MPYMPRTYESVRETGKGEMILQSSFTIVWEARRDSRGPKVNAFQVPPWSNQSHLSFNIQWGFISDNPSLPPRITKFTDVQALLFIDELLA